MDIPVFRKEPKSRTLIIRVSCPQIMRDTWERGVYRNEGTRSYTTKEVNKRVPGRLPCVTL